MKSSLDWHVNETLNSKIFQTNEAYVNILQRMNQKSINFTEDIKMIFIKKNSFLELRPLRGIDGKVEDSPLFRTCH